MTTLRERITVSLGIDEAFSYTADFSNIEHWDPGIAESARRGDAPIGVGSEFDLVAVFGKSKVPMVYTITEFDPPRKVVFEGRGEALTAIDTLTFSAETEGTVIDYRADLTFHNFIRFIEPFLSRTFKRVGEKAVNGLKAALDSRDQSAA